MLKTLFHKNKQSQPLYKIIVHNEKPLSIEQRMSLGVLIADDRFRNYEKLLKIQSDKWIKKELESETMEEKRYAMGALQALADLTQANVALYNESQNK